MVDKCVEARLHEEDLVSIKVHDESQSNGPPRANANEDSDNVPPAIERDERLSRIKQIQ